MSLVLKAESRAQIGSAHSRRLRGAGKIPAVVYGAGAENQVVTLDYVEFVKVFQKARMHQTIALEVNGKQTEVLVQNVTNEPVSKRPFHVDFYRIQKGRPLTADIPMRLVGTPIGVRRGGILEFFVPNLRVRCNPEDLLSEFELDISGLEVGSAIYVRDLKTPDSMKVLTKDSQCVARVTSSRATKMAEAQQRDGK